MNIYSEFMGTDDSNQSSFQMNTFCFLCFVVFRDFLIRVIVISSMAAEVFLCKGPLSLGFHSSIPLTFHPSLFCFVSRSSSIRSCSAAYEDQQLLQQPKVGCHPPSSSFFKGLGQFPSRLMKRTLLK